VHIFAGKQMQYAEESVSNQRFTCIIFQCAIISVYKHRSL